MSISPQAPGHRDRLELFLQRAVAWIFTPVSYYLAWFWMRFVRGYRIEGCGPTARRSGGAWATTAVRCWCAPTI